MTVFNGNAFFEGTLRGRFRELLQYYSVLQSIIPELLCTTKYYSSTTLRV